MQNDQYFLQNILDIKLNLKDFKRNVLYFERNIRESEIFEILRFRAK